MNLENPIIDDTIVDTVALLQNFVDSPVSFLTGGAYWLNSALLGQFYRCEDIPSGMPNVWYVMSSIPGRCRRSAVLGAYVTIYRKVMYKYLDKMGFVKRYNQDLREKYEALSEKEQKKKTNKPRYISPLIYIENTRLEEGTPEGIMDAIQYAYENYKIEAFHFTNPEFGGTLSQMGKRNTPYGISRIMSMLWSAEAGKVNLSARSDKGSVRYVPEGLFVTLFCGMQEPWTYVDKKSIKQGLMRRAPVDYVLAHNKYLPLISLTRRRYKIAIDTISDKLTERMLKVYDHVSDYSYDHLHAGFEVDAWPPINEYDEYWNRKVDKHGTLVNIMLQSKGVHLSKLALVRAMARGDFQRDGCVSATLRDVEESKNFIESITKNYDIWVANIGLEDKPMRRLEGYDRMMEHLDTVTDFLTAHLLNRKMGNAVSSEDVRKWYQTGRARGEMRSVYVIKPSAKKTSIYVFLERHRVAFENWVEQNGWSIGAWRTKLDEELRI